MKTRSLLLTILTLSGALVASSAWAGEGPTPVTKLQLQRGRLIFQKICFSCHQITGRGLPGVYPPLANSDFILNHQRRAIPVLLQGLRGPIKVDGKIYKSVMPNLNLTDQQIADVLTYVSNSWGNRGAAVTKKMVAKERKALAKAAGANQLAAGSTRSNGPARGGMMGGGMMGGRGMMGGGTMGGMGMMGARNR